MDRKAFWILASIGAGIILLGGSMYTTYKNRFGKRVVLLRSILDKFLAMKAALAAQGIQIEMTDGWRGETEQEKAFSGGFSKAHFGFSPHNFGAAFDVAPVINGRLSWPDDSGLWASIGSAGKDQGLVWGGNFTSFKDLPHFEMAGWKTSGLALLKTAPEAPTYA